MPASLATPRVDAAGMRALVTERVATLSQLEAIAPQWQRLCEYAAARPFQSPAWLLPWWRHVGRGELACVAVRDDATSELAGFAPLYVYTHEDGRRHLFPLGIATTDYLDAVALPAMRDAVIAAIRGHLRAAAFPEWDVLEAPQLAPDALLAQLSPEGELADDEPHPVLALDGAWPDAMRKALGYARRRAARSGSVEYTLADGATVLRALDELEALHGMRWARRGEPGVLGEPGVMAWHREAAPGLLAMGVLRLLTLRLAGRLAASLYCIADPARRTWYDYIGGFDPQLAAASPGHLLVGHAIELAQAEGATGFDFLRGREAYKYQWGAVDRPMHLLRIAR